MKKHVLERMSKDQLHKEMEFHYSMVKHCNECCKGARSDDFERNQLQAGLHQEKYDQYENELQKRKEDTESYPSMSEMQEEGLNPASSGDAMLFSLCRKRKPDGPKEGRED